MIMTPNSGRKFEAPIRLALALILGLFALPLTTCWLSVERESIVHGFDISSAVSNFHSKSDCPSSPSPDHHGHFLCEKNVSILPTGTLEALKERHISPTASNTFLQIVANELTRVRLRVYPTQIHLFAIHLALRVMEPIVLQV